MKLSVIIPVYNERLTLPKILVKVIQVFPKFSKEIILIDDGSTDGTREWLSDTLGNINLDPIYITLNGDQILKVDPAIEASIISVKVIFHEKNQGKGAALRTGFQAATGEVLVIQDADLEYDPQDWTRMLPLIRDGHADIVYGSRFYGEPHRVLYFHHWLGNKVISNLINVICDTTLSDIEVCYKMFRAEVIKDMTLISNDFGFEVEFTVKVAQPKKWKIYELGISYYGRTYKEGKKINWKDGVKALWYIIKYSFFG